MARVLLIDNYDSFTFNLAEALRSAGAEVTVVTHDGDDAVAALRGFAGVVLGPGPCAPDAAGISLAVAALALAGAAPPLLGVCLGHQCIAAAAGGSIVRAEPPVHGDTVAVRHDGRGLYAGAPTPFAVTRYNSLTVAEPLPPPLVACAWDEHGSLMALRHADLPIDGLQFHPESWLSETPVLSRWVAGLVR